MTLVETYNLRAWEAYNGDKGKKWLNPLGDHDLFARREKARVLQISSCLILEICTIDLGNNNYTNSYDITWRSDGQKDFTPLIISSDRKFYIRRKLINDESVALAVNGGFFFLADEAESLPIEATYNLCIRDGKVVGLPCSNYPAIFVKDGLLYGREVKAEGIVEIGGESIRWTGSKNTSSVENVGATLYNSACCTIDHVADPITGAKRVLNTEKNHTPQTRGFDLVIGQDKEGMLEIVDIKEGGMTDIFKGNFILQVEDTTQLGKYRIGQKVNPTMVDTLRIGEIDSAVTVGPSIKHFLSYADHPVNHDSSLGGNPPFTLEEKKARSLIYMDNSGNIHFRLFDGSPKSSNFKGVSVEEVCKIIPLHDIEWGYYLDPGQTAKIVARLPEGVIPFGNTHYMRWPKDARGEFLWNAPNGRMIPSAIILQTKK